MREVSLLSMHPEPAITVDKSVKEILTTFDSFEIRIKFDQIIKRMLANAVIVKAIDPRLFSNV